MCEQGESSSGGPRGFGPPAPNFLGLDALGARRYVWENTMSEGGVQIFRFAPEQGQEGQTAPAPKLAPPRFSNQRAAAQPGWFDPSNLSLYVRTNDYRNTTLDDALIIEDVIRAPEWGCIATNDPAGANGRLRFEGDTRAPEDFSVDGKIIFNKLKDLFCFQLDPTKRWMDVSYFRGPTTADRVLGIRFPEFRDITRVAFCAPEPHPGVPGWDFEDWCNRFCAPSGHPAIPQWQNFWFVDTQWATAHFPKIKEMYFIDFGATLKPGVTLDALHKETKTFAGNGCVFVEMHRDDWFRCWTGFDLSAAGTPSRHRVSRELIQPIRQGHVEPSEAALWARTGQRPDHLSYPHLSRSLSAFPLDDMPDFWEDADPHSVRKIEYRLLACIPMGRDEKGNLQAQEGPMGHYLL